MTDLSNYMDKYNELIRKINRLEGEYKTIYNNSFLYDNYFIQLQDSSYYSLNKDNYGKIGMYYYKNNDLIEQSEYKESKDQLKQILDKSEYKKDYNYKFLIENNYCFGMLRYKSEKNKISLRRIREYEAWYVSLEKERLLLYNQNILIKIPNFEFSLYNLSEYYKPIILELKNINRLLRLLENKFYLHIQYNLITGIREDINGIRKEIVDLSSLDIDQEHNFSMLEIEKNERIEIDYLIIEELDKQKEGNYLIYDKERKFYIKNKETIELELKNDLQIEPITMNEKFT